MVTGPFIGALMAGALVWAFTEHTVLTYAAMGIAFVWAWWWTLANG